MGVVGSSDLGCGIVRLGLFGGDVPFASVPMGVGVFAKGDNAGVQVVGGSRGNITVYRTSPLIFTLSPVNWAYNSLQELELQVFKL